MCAKTTQEENIEWYNMQKLKQYQHFYLLFIVDN